MFNEKIYAWRSTLALLVMAFMFSMLTACGSDDKTSTPVAMQPLSSVSATKAAKTTEPAGLGSISSPISAAAAEAVAITPESGTWFETAYATWTGADAGYRAYVRTLGAFNWRDGAPITGWLTDWSARWMLLATHGG